MSTEQAAPKRIMAIDPGMLYLGIAILEGEELIWYGIKPFPGALPYNSPVAPTILVSRFRRRRSWSHVLSQAGSFKSLSLKSIGQCAQQWKCVITGFPSAHLEILWRTRERFFSESTLWPS